MPPAPRAETFEILQGLNPSWPHYESMTWTDHGKDDSGRDFVNRYLHALQWLTDMGLVTFETMSVGPSSLSIRQAALTSRGRDYIASNLFSVDDGLSEGGERGSQ